MKTKKKKLTLTKDTIATLTGTQLVSVQGGVNDDTVKPCQVETYISYWDCTETITYEPTCEPCLSIFC